MIEFFGLLLDICTGCGKKSSLESRLKAACFDASTEAVSICYDEV